MAGAACYASTVCEIKRSRIVTMSPLDQCAFALGNFMLNFGTLDLDLFEFLERHLPAGKFAEAREEPFNQRLKRAGRILFRSKMEADTFGQLQAKLEPLRVLRNHIAHGHLLVRTDPTSGQLTIAIARSEDQDNAALYNNTAIGLAELQAAALAVADLIPEFQKLFGLYQTNVPLGLDKNT